MAEAHALLAETEIWKSAFALSKQLDDMTRLDLGNVIYTHSMDVSESSTNFFFLHTLLWRVCVSDLGLWGELMVCC